VTNEKLFDLGYEVRRLLSLHGEMEGTNLRGAIRDLLTEVAHVCRERGIDFDERVDAAAEIAASEVES